MGDLLGQTPLPAHPPARLVAGHLEGDQPVPVYRVAELERTITELREREVTVAVRFEIPHGPGAELTNPGPQRIAIYQLTRPEASEITGTFLDTSGVTVPVTLSSGATLRSTAVASLN